jgi:hypothetical protein
VAKLGRFCVSIGGYRVTDPSLSQNARDLAATAFKYIIAVIGW